MVRYGSYEGTPSLGEAIWDQKAGQLVCYGRIDADHSIYVRMTRATWEGALRAFATSITRDSPFRK